MKQLAVAVAMLGLLAGCGGGSNLDEAETATEPGTVSRAEFGGRWPLTVAKGALRCEGSQGVGAVVFETVDGREFGLNGLAQREYPPVDPIWRYEPGLKKYGLRVSMGPLIERGLALCR